MKAGIIKSNEANPDLVAVVRQKLIDLGYEVDSYKGGKYNNNHIVDKDIIVAINYPNSTEIHNDLDGVDYYCSFMGKGLGGEITDAIDMYKPDEYFTSPVFIINDFSGNAWVPHMYPEIYDGKDYKRKYWAVDVVSFKDNISFNPTDNMLIKEILKAIKSYNCNDDNNDYGEVNDDPTVDMRFI